MSCTRLASGTAMVAARFGGATGRSVFGFGPFAVQPPKYFSIVARASSGVDLADDDDGRQVGAEHGLIVGAHVVERQRTHGFRRCLARARDRPFGTAPGAAAQR